MVSSHEFHKEKEYIWKKFSELDVNISNLLDKIDDIKKSANTHQKDAAQASRKTSEFRNKTQDKYHESLEYTSSLKKKLSEIEDLLERAIDQEATINTSAAETSKLEEQIEERNNQFLDYVSSIENKLESINELLAENSNLESDLENFSSILKDNESNYSKIKLLLSNANSKSEEITEIYDNIHGYEDYDEEKEEDIVIPGLKDKLEKSYKDIDAQIKGFEKEFEVFKDNLESKHIEEIKQKELSFDRLIKKCELEFNEKKSEIETLLPSSLSAGLSHAYARKKREETRSLYQHNKAFMRAIQWLTIISLIPVTIDIYLLLRGDDLVNVIAETPKLILAILPLYFPALWIAYKTNKQINLSKRLIEEYTHKEVLNRTVEGLSTQIDNLDDSSISTELRTRLLYNILEISSENPGKLISDYNKSDHPVMDVLEKSSNLSKAVNKFSNIPGINELLRKAQKQNMAELHKEDLNVTQALNGKEQFSNKSDKVESTTV